ncbi:MAG: M15 family metallopeptidase [Treponema sp.]|nr:M15 family metallopeptidase [Treponema sp.]
MSKLSFLCFFVFFLIFSASCQTSPLSIAEQVMKAHGAAFPEAISRVEERDGDWAVLLRGKWFYYADGRLLPEEERNNASSWAQQSFYNYPVELPPWKEPEGEQAEWLRNELANRREDPPKRNPDFYDILWRASTEKEATANMVRINFFGRNFDVHKDLKDILVKINALVMEAAKTDKEVRDFINEIGYIGAFSWRNVAATASRSYHSYGIAIDILPKNLQSRATYWQWTSDEGNPEWYKIPYEKRYHPPMSVVKIFERYGFCWGGKWSLFDTMHFEYRPEISILFGINSDDQEQTYTPPEGVSYTGDMYLIFEGY